MEIITGHNKQDSARSARPAEESVLNIQKEQRNAKNCFQSHRYN